MFEYMFAFFAWFACSRISLNDLHMFASFCIYLDMMFRIWFEYVLHVLHVFCVSGGCECHI